MPIHERDIAIHPPAFLCVPAVFGLDEGTHYNMLYIRLGRSLRLKMIILRYRMEDSLQLPEGHLHALPFAKPASRFFLPPNRRTLSNNTFQPERK